MKIVFLGTSYGVPEPNRKCSCTMIETENNRYFIDMGTQSIEQLNTRNIPIESVKAVFITHMHCDHTNGLISFIDLCNGFYTNANPVFVLPEPIEDTVSAVKGWLKCNGCNLREFNFQPVKEGVCYQDETIKITAFKTQHTNISYAYLLEGEGKRVLFTGDLSTKGPQVDFPMAIFEKTVDLAVCECAHFPATAYIPLFKDQNNLKSVCFNHYPISRVPSLLEIKKELKEICINIATDNMEITL